MDDDDVEMICKVMCNNCYSYMQPYFFLVLLVVKNLSQYTAYIRYCLTFNFCVAYQYGLPSKGTCTQHIIVM